MFLFEYFERGAFLVQHLTAGGDIERQFLLGRTGLHARKGRFHPAKVGLDTSDDTFLVRDLTADIFSGLHGLLLQDIDSQTGLVKASRQVVLHQKFDLYWFHCLFMLLNCFEKMIRYRQPPPGRLPCLPFQACQPHSRFFPVFLPPGALHSAGHPRAS